MCLGTMSFVGAGGMGSVDEDAAAAIVIAALRQGVNFFDTAEAYNDFAADGVLGRALRRAFDEGVTTREQVVVAGKFGKHQGETSVQYSGDMIEASCTKSLDALGMDFIDLYQVHWSSNMLSADDTVAALERLKATGKIREYGVCNFGVRRLQEFLDAGGRPITNQLPYNLLWRAVEFEILPLCQERGVAVLTYSSLQQGLLTGRYTEASQVPEGRRRSRHFAGDSTPLSRHGQPGWEGLTFSTVAALVERCGKGGALSDWAVRWLLRRPGVTCVLIGASNAEQVTANTAAIADVPDVDLTEDLSSLTDELKTALGPDPDMWARASRY